MNFKIKTLSALAAVAALSLASCSSEEPLGNNNTQEREGIGYMSFTIANPADGTRAGETWNPEVDGDKTANDGEIFNNGSANEYAICPNNNANAAFFFTNGEFWGMSNLQAVNNTGMGHEATHPNENYAEKYYTYMTRWRNDNNRNKPNQVIVVLNADPNKLEELADKNPTLDNFREFESVFTNETAETGYKYGVYNYADTKFFTMSSSVFFDGSNDDQTATSIEGVQVCETAEQALQNPVTVYVERLLSKFQLGFGPQSFEFSDKPGDFIFYPFAEGATKVDDMATINVVTSYDGKDDNLDYPEYTRSQWAAYIVSWGMNALEKKESMIKNAPNPNDYFQGWNNFGFHRSYWGESSLYSDNGKEKGFTTQYRYAGYDPEAGKYSTKFYGNDKYSSGNETAQLNALHYISYNAMQNRAAYKYVGERTYNAEEGLENYGPYRYATHYLIGAQLLIDGVDYRSDLGNRLIYPQKEGNMLSQIGDKYYAYNFYFAGYDAKNDYIRYAYHRMASKFADGRTHNLYHPNTTDDLKFPTASTGKLYKEDGTPISVQEAADYFTTQSAQIIHGDGKVTLKATKDIYYKNSDDQLVKFTEDQLTALVYNYAEAARHFHKGAMYYAIPVQHKLGKTFGDMVQINKENVEYALGQFGVVRNHWYRLTVNTIGSIGIPVDNPDQPIIPDPEDDYYIAIEIVVLPWHVIDNGIVDL